MTESDLRFDVAIAGAGVAGCFLARDLARQGLRVGLFERQPAERMGHDWWDTIDLRVLDAVGVAHPRPPERVASFDFHILAAGEDTGRRAAMPAHHANVDRKLLARRLLADARQAGAEVFLEHAVVGPVRDGARTVGFSVRGGGVVREVRAPVSVDASGAVGVLRAAAPLGFGFSRHLGRDQVFRTYREIRRDTSAGGRSLVELGTADGVIWVSRAESGLVDVFAGVVPRPDQPRPEDMVAAVVAREGGMGPVVRGGHPAIIPLRRSFDAFVAPGLMLIGDAAAMANPLNGSGMSAALLAAQLAAATLKDAFARGVFDVPALWPYVAAYQRSQGAAFAKLDVVQRFIFAEPRAGVLALLASGVLPEGALWDLEEELAPSRLVRRLDRVPPLARHPGLLLRLSRALLAASLLASHYGRFPETFAASTFHAWQTRAERLVLLSSAG